MRRKMNSGRLISHQVVLEPHELDTIKVLLQLGEDIDLVQTSKQKGRHTPDIIWRGKPWEIKSPKVGSKSALEHIFKKAMRQCENVIFDLSRLKGNNNVVVILEKIFNVSRRANRMVIVTKDKQVLDFLKK